LLINSIGCFAIGVLMVCVTEAWTTGRWANPLVRPFLGTGILGGFTTFSTYTDEIRARLDSGATAVAFTYLAGSIMLCLGAVAVGMTLTRYVIESTE
jgi:CrcB protein